VDDTLANSAINFVKVQFIYVATWIKTSYKLENAWQRLAYSPLVVVSPPSKYL